MTLANPLALLWGLLAIPVVILYWRRLRLRREAVATNMIWKQVFAAEGTRQSWQRWRHPVSLAVQLAVLLLLVVALARPLIPRPRRLVLVLDNSAGMSAADVKPTRLGQVKQAAERIVAGLRWCDTAAVVSTGGAAGVRCTPTSDRDTLRKAIESVTPVEGVSHMEPALALARQMLAQEPGGKILVLTDGCFDGATELAAADDVEMILAGKSTGNLAVTQMAARCNGGDATKCQVLVEVGNFADEPAECELRLTLDDVPVGVASIELAANGHRQHVFETATPDTGRFVARIESRDARPGDNQASAPVPQREESRFGDLPEAEVLAALGTRRRESDLRPTGSSGTAAAEVPAGEPGLPVWLYLALAGMVLLIAEWCLYQRRWIS